MNDQSSPDRYRKRQRVSQACDSCRERKTRCDGRQLICIACESRGIGHACRFTYVPKRRRASLEKQTTQHEHTKSYVERTSARRQEVANGSVSDDAEPSYKEPWSAAPSDGLGTFAGQSDASMYGPSSTVSFLRHLVSRGSRLGTEIPATRNDGMMERAELGQENRALFPAPTSRMEEDQPVLPDRRTADDLLRCYWEFVHPVFPLLHKPTFVAQYERLCTSSDSSANVEDGREPRVDDSIFLCTLKLVFALGSKLSPLIPSRQKPYTADEFYNQSRPILTYLILDSSSISTVQMLALTGVYLQSTQYAGRCWNAVGLAIRMAQSLGLHVETAGRNGVPQLEREMRRRTWHTCVCLDRFVVECRNHSSK